MKFCPYNAIAYTFGIVWDAGASGRRVSRGGVAARGVRAEAAVVRAALDDLRAALESARGPATCPPSSWCRVAAFLYYLKS